MTALRKLSEPTFEIREQTAETSNSDMLMGEITGGFISGSAPTMSSDATMGEITGGFISGSAPTMSSDATMGEVTGGFISGSAPTMISLPYNGDQGLPQVKK